MRGRGFACGAGVVDSGFNGPDPGCIVQRRGYVIQAKGSLRNAEMPCVVEPGDA
jgi:hypothetical protein